MLLEVRDIAVAYGTARVLHGVSLTVANGETVTLIGANGAGKTSCLRAISGLNRWPRGSIRFDGERIDTLAPRQRLERGLVHVPEGKRLFPRMTVRENLAMGAFLRGDGASIRSDIDAMFARFPILHARQGQQAGSLSGGEQQILAFARGLMARPKLLLVDEPTVGLSPLMVKELSARCGRSTPTASRSCWWNRTPPWPCVWPAAAICWKPEAASPRTRRGR